jgi:hypothetical protein
MKLRPRPLVASLVLAAASLLPTADAEACGGCFIPSTETQSTVVTGHRMAFAISTTQTVLWDQIKYAGSPSDFAWVLPVKGGAVIQASNDAWFETLDAATAAQVVSPPQNCFGPSSGGGCGIGCGSASSASFDGPADTTGAGAPPPVTVTHEGTVGPYQTVTLHANVPNALPSWLTANGYNIDPTVSPIIDAYTSAGFDFIALRLQPGMGVQQMKPVRVVTAGASPSLPLRMVAAGTGANVAITLFVIGEGRWEPQNFPHAALDPNKLTWDFVTQSSDYATQRLALMAAGNGLTWNDAFANQGSLLSQDVVNGQPTSISVGGFVASTLAQAYAEQGENDMEASPSDVGACTISFAAYAASTDQVVACSPGAGGSGTGGGGAGGADAGSGGGSTGGSGTGGGSSGPPCSGLAANQIPASVFACGPLDDIAIALVGMHPQSVWLSRLEANLPHAGLANDLVLEAASQQTPVSNIFNLTRSIGDPCAVYPVDAGAGTMRSARDAWIRNQVVVYGAVLAAVAAAVARRRGSMLARSRARSPGR